MQTILEAGSCDMEIVITIWMSEQNMHGRTRLVSPLLLYVVCALPVITCPKVLTVVRSDWVCLWAD